MPFSDSTGQGAYGVIGEEDTADHMPCVLDCGDNECVEWINVFLLQGENLAEAAEALEREEYIGAAYHVSECRMADNKDAL
ncbi:MAG: hypothetical protein OXI16_13835 [Chloroflexota bacterium]|nr:hypothetical protein [Chloroflexota bacterium]